MKCPVCKPGKLKHKEDKIDDGIVREVWECDDCKYVEYIAKS